MRTTLGAAGLTSPQFVNGVTINGTNPALVLSNTTTGYSVALEDVGTTANRNFAFPNTDGYIAVTDQADGRINFLIGGVNAVPVANGGTGSSSSSGARTNLGLAIGTNVQAYNANTTTLGNTIELDGSEVANILPKLKGGTGAAGIPDVIVIVVTDATTAITTGTGKREIPLPFACTVTGVRAFALTAPTGSVATFDVNERTAGGSPVSILSTPITIDATEHDSDTAATPPVISDTGLAKTSTLVVDFDGVGATIAGAGIFIFVEVLR